MAVKITDICICCDSCIDECPTNSIVDESENPNGDNIYFVDNETCTECIGDNPNPTCAEACPTEGCIVWDNPKTENKIHGQACED
jgi:ferredoxin